jgi:hypothetical protein
MSARGRYSFRFWPEFGVVFSNPPLLTTLQAANGKPPRLLLSIGGDNIPAMSASVVSVSGDSPDITAGVSVHLEDTVELQRQRTGLATLFIEVAQFDHRLTKGREVDKFMSSMTVAVCPFDFGLLHDFARNGGRVLMLSLCVHSQKRVTHQSIFQEVYPLCLKSLPESVVLPVLKSTFHMETSSCSHNCFRWGYMVCCRVASWTCD